MKALTKEDKARIKFRYAAGLHKALQKSNFTSFRKLAKEAGMEPAHIQRISVGKTDVTLTTSTALASALGISYSELSAFYDNVTEKDIEKFVEYLNNQKSIRGKK